MTFGRKKPSGRRSSQADAYQLALALDCIYENRDSAANGASPVKGAVRREEHEKERCLDKANV